MFALISRVRVCTVFRKTNYIVRVILVKTVKKCVIVFQFSQIPTIVSLADWSGEADARRTYVIGPINSVETVLSDRQELFKGMNLPVEWEIGLDRLAESLPMMSFLSLFPYTQMLHYALTGEKVARSQIAMQQGPPGKPSSQKPGRRDRHRIYSREQAVLSHIRNGDLNYQADWNRIVSQASGVRIFSDGMLQRGKVSVITFIVSACVLAPPSKADCPPNVPSAKEIAIYKTHWPVVRLATCARSTAQCMRILSAVSTHCAKVRAAPLPSTAAANIWRSIWKKMLLRIDWQIWLDIQNII